MAVGGGGEWRYSIHKIGCTSDERKFWDVRLKDWDNLKINNPIKPLPHLGYRIKRGILPETRNQGHSTEAKAMAFGNWELDP